MNKDSFDKIINLDVNDIKINDFKQALFFFLELKDENLKKIFLYASNILKINQKVKKYFVF